MVTSINSKKASVIAERMFNAILDEIILTYDLDEKEVYTVDGKLAQYDEYLGKYYGFEIPLEDDFTYRYLIEPNKYGGVTFIEYVYDEGVPLTVTEMDMDTFLDELFDTLTLV